MFTLRLFACIGEYAEVGDNTVVHPHVTIGSGAKVGNDCIIYANSIYHDCRVGNHRIPHSVCVIGADGFFAPTSEGYEKIPQIGITILKTMWKSVPTRVGPCYYGSHHRTPAA